MGRGSCLRTRSWGIREQFRFQLRRHSGVRGEFLTWIVLRTCRTGVGLRGGWVWGHGGAIVSLGGLIMVWTMITTPVLLEADDEPREVGRGGMLTVRTTSIISMGPLAGVVQGLLQLRVLVHTMAVMGVSGMVQGWVTGLTRVTLDLDRALLDITSLVCQPMTSLSKGVHLGLSRDHSGQTLLGQTRLLGTSGVHAS